MHPPKPPGNKKLHQGEGVEATYKHRRPFNVFKGYFIIKTINIIFFSVSGSVSGLPPGRPVLVIPKYVLKTINLICKES